MPRSQGSGSVRWWITVAVLLAAFVLLQTMSHGEAIVARQPLHELPYVLGSWTAQDQPLQDRVLQVAGVSDYTNRIYVQPGKTPVQLYVGYYASQRTGDTIHSPKNCLPGSGWDPIQSGYAAILVPGGHNIVVNQYVIQRDQDKQLVFYWYQGRGRVIASEYAGKFWMVVDAIRRNRTDGALVRLVTPMNDGEDVARARLVSLTEALYPSLREFVPN
jgi:EpsI family protein